MRHPAAHPHHPIESARSAAPATATRPPSSQLLPPTSAPARRASPHAPRPVPPAPRPCLRPRELCFGSPSMSHRVEDHVDPQRIRDFFGEHFEEILILTFALPAIAIVGIVRGKHHQPPLVVRDHAMMHRPCVAVVMLL